MAHPYKDKACGGQAMAKKRYADGGETDMGLYGEPGGPEGHPTGAGTKGVNWDFVAKGLKTARGAGGAPDHHQNPLKLTPMQLSPMKKADGGTIKMPMKLKMLKLKGMK